MAMDLISQKKQWRISDWGWDFIMALVESSNCTPIDTKSLDPSLWPQTMLDRSPKSRNAWYRDYNSHDWQEVTVDDATNIVNDLRETIQAIESGRRDHCLLYMGFCDSEYEGGQDAFIMDTINFCEAFIEFCKDAPFLIG